ncbi:MAG: PAS domain-containing protein, partial [Rickettsiales bacterium]|nr:PAS domain-containing protein [Rickettsiales bacterium]
MAPAPDKICSSPRLLRSLVILPLVLSGGIIAALLLLPKDLWQMTLISASGGLLLILVALLLISYRLSARLNMRIALELDEKKFRTLFTATPYPQMVLMHDRIHLCNNALVQAFGYDDSAKLIGKRFLELSPDTQPDDRPSEASYLEILETLNTEESVQLEWTFCDSHDNPLIMELSLSRTKIGSDDVMLAILKDLSDI